MYMQLDFSIEISDNSRMKTVFRLCQIWNRVFHIGDSGEEEGAKNERFIHANIVLLHVK